MSDIRDTYDAPIALDVEGTDWAVKLEGRKLVAYALVWGAISSPRKDGLRHVYERGSLTWAADPLALYHHNAADILARVSNGTLKLVEDDIGVRAEIDLDDTTLGEDMLKRVTSRLVAGMSFGVYRKPSDVEQTGTPGVIRITRAFADEVSLTPTPAMTAATVVLAAQADQLTKQVEAAKIKQEQIVKASKTRLAAVRLSMLRPISQ